MNPGEFNELMSEAIAESEDLAAAAGDASAVLERLKQRAESLSQVLSREGEESHTHFQDLASRLEASEDELEQRGADTRTTLEGVAARADEVKDRAAEARGTIAEALGDLGQRRQGVSSELQGELAQVEESLQSLGRQVEAAAGELEERLQALSAREDRLREAVDEARQELEEKAAAWTGGLEDLERVGIERAQAYVAGMSALVHSQTALLVDFCNRMITEHNEAVVALRRQFAEQATARIAEAAEPLRAALEALSTLCEQEDDVITQRAGLAVEQVAEVSALVAKVAQLFPAADRLSER